VAGVGANSLQRSIRRAYFLCFFSTETPFCVLPNHQAALETETRGTTALLNTGRNHPSSQFANQKRFYLQQNRLGCKLLKLTVCS
jgi:hypothetical protein